MPKKLNYTPPPWYHDKYYITNYPLDDSNGPSRKGARCIACAPSGASGNEFKLGDADIMTAAPDMYRALKVIHDALDALERGDGIVSEAIEQIVNLALAKAEGES